jgi:hypothetical protein
MWPLKPRRKDRSVAAARQAGRHGAVGPVAGRTSASSAIQRTGRPLAVVYRARFSLESGPRCRIPGRARSPAARSTSRRLGRPMSSPCRIVTRGRDVDQGEGAQVSAEGGGCGLVAGSSTMPPGGNRAGPDDQAHQPCPQRSGNKVSAASGSAEARRGQLLRSQVIVLRRSGITGLVAARRPASRGWLSRSGATEPASLVCGPRAECQCLSDLSP